MTWPFGDLKRHHYQLLVIDPPWVFKTYSEKGKEQKSPEVHYDCMSLDDIKALPVKDLAAEDAVVFLWTTWPILASGQALDVLHAWGFTPKTGGHWHKTTKHGKIAFGTGYLVRCASEPWLLATQGDPRKFLSKSARNAIVGPVREHSRKPEEAFAWFDLFAPRVSRCELFARQRREGWDVWGNEVEKFNKTLSEV